jgi:protein involved in polysaccharide export with SLBB domain
MPYLVRAEVEKPGSGTFKTEADTKRDAIEKAQGPTIPGASGCYHWPQGRAGR